MAAGYLPAPGSEYGPCVEPCKHTDCAMTRQEAETICRLCNKPIGYDTGHFNEGHGPSHPEFDRWRLVHSICVSSELRQHLKTLGLTQARAAKALHIASVSTMWRYCNGRLPIPGPVEAAVKCWLDRFERFGKGVQDG